MDYEESWRLLKRSAVQWGSIIFCQFILRFGFTVEKDDILEPFQYLSGKLALGSIGAKPNLYCEAIELVCGGSPIGCGLIERKAQDRVKWEG